MATHFSKLDIEKEGKAFVTTVLNDPDFKKEGFLYGHKPEWLFWAAVDGARHPLYVWQKGGIADYPESAKKLGSAAFSNGPMMANPSFSAPSPPPLGPVHGEHHKVDDKGAGSVDSWLYLFGRKEAGKGGPVFADYQIVKSADIKGYAEVITALIPLIVDGHPCSVHEKKAGAPDPHFNPGYRDLIEGQPGHEGNKRVAAWALVPAPQPPQGGEGDPSPAPVAGIVLAIGTGWDGHIKKIVTILQAIGTLNAVAMDGSTSAMLGEHKDAWFTPEGGAGVIKNLWQKYGFCCGGS